MKKPQFLDDLSNRLCDALPANVKTLKKDIEKNFHTILQNTFTKLDLITRKEFDAQTKVLARSRQKIEALEVKLKKLADMIKKSDQK